jgi:multisubunit Na+/H+ antiporter MnhF subunit
MSLNLIEQAALVLIVLAILFGLIRLLLGPSPADRIVAADTLAVITTAGIVGFAAWFANPVYLDVALVYGTLAFVGVVALARAIEGGRE